MDWIDDIITGLTEIYDTNNIYDIYDCLDIQIIKLNEENVLLKGNDGFYQRNYFDKEVVCIREGLDYKYERFVLAHELGHAILHTKIHVAAFNFNLINFGKVERQATYFALKLLDIYIDPVDFEGLDMEQISRALHLPKDCLVLV